MKNKEFYKWLFKTGQIFKYIFESKKQKNNLASKYLFTFVERAKKNQIEFLGKDNYNVEFVYENLFWSIWIENKWYAYASSIKYDKFDPKTNYHVASNSIETDSSSKRPCLFAKYLFYTEIEEKIPNIKDLEKDPLRLWLNSYTLSFLK